MLEEKITVLTKSITILKESLKNDRLMRLMMIKKQCEDVSMPLGCMGLENDSQKEQVECVLEEENMEVSLTSFEPKYVCVETQHEEVMSNEPEIVVGVEEVESLKVSSLDKPRQEGIAAGALLCTCEDCVKEFQSHEVDEMLGLEVGQAVPIGVAEVQTGSTTKSQDEGLYIATVPATQVGGVNENRRDLVEPNVGGYRRWSQWVRTYLKYDLPWVTWLIMMTVENGVVSYLWSWRGMILMCVDGEKESEVAVSHRCSFANNDSNCKWKVENQLLVTVRMQLRGCHGELFKVQSEAAQSIGKWFDLTEFDMKENKEDVVAMHVHGIMRPVSFILETRIPVVSNNQSLKLDAKIFEKNTVDYFLKNSVGDDLKHTTDVGIVGLLCDDLNLKSSIWKAENYRGRIWCKVLYPFHYGKINCKMKIVHSSTNKNHLMQLIKWIISTDARENELVMILKWELKIMPIVEFKNTWVGIVNTTVVAARTNSDKTAKDVIEWMIAWERQTQY